MKLDAVRRFALSLPETTQEPHFASTSFRVKGKIFATSPPPGEYVHVFVTDEQRDAALAMYPEFIEKLFWGGKVRGLRVVLERATPQVVTDLLTTAWLGKAPKNLVKATSAPPLRSKRAARARPSSD